MLTVLNFLHLHPLHSQNYRSFGFVTHETTQQYLEAESKFLELIRRYAPVPKKVADSIAADLLNKEMLGTKYNYVEDMVSPGNETVLSKAFNGFITFIDDAIKHRR